VTDVNLQGRLSGWDIASRIRESKPAFPIIYITGAAAEEWPSKGVPNSILLQKPFAPAQLTTALSNLLNVATQQLAATIGPTPADDDPRSNGSTGTNE
jgi:DNA-binding response OmpR family regulator